MHNLSLSDFDLVADYTHVKIMIISTMGTNLLRNQYNMIVQPVKRSPEQLFYYRNDSFNNFLPSNYKGFTCLSNEIMQSNYIVIENDKVI